MCRMDEGDWVKWDDYEKLQSDYKKVEDSLRHYIEQEALRKIGETLHQQNIDSGAYNREKNETIKALKADNEKLRFASRCDIPKLYSQINFVDKKWEVVRLGAKDDVEDNGEKCVRVTITLVETK